MSRVRDIWDEGAPIYDRIYANNVPYHRSHAAMVDMLPKDRPLQVLDLGAGTGLVGLRVLERVPESRVTCLEFSANMVAEARRKLASFGDRASFVCADMVTWTPPQAYDAIVTCNALVYRDIGLGECYAKYARALKPGGVLLNSTVVKTDALPLLAELMQNVNASVASPVAPDVTEFARTTGRDIAHFGEGSLAVARPVAEHLALLTGAGLVASCPWRYLTQAVVAGVRSASLPPSGGGQP